MDRQSDEALVSGAAAKVGDTVSDLTAKSQEMVQDKIEQAKPVFQDLRESAGAVVEKATDLAQKASTAGVQAVDTMQGVARDVGNQASQAATSAYQQTAQAGRYVSRYAAEQPLMALLAAAAIGYGLAYLIHRRS